MSLTNSKNGKSRSGNGSPLVIDSPYDRSNIIKKYWLAYMIPLFRISFERQLTIEDIGPPPRVDYSRTLGLRLQQVYNQEILNRKRPSFIRSMMKTFGPQLLLLGFVDLLSKCLAFPMQTIALGWLIRDAGIYLNFAPQAMATQAAPPLNDTLAQAATTTTTLPPNMPLNNMVTVPPLAVGPAVLAIEGGLTSEQAYWRIIYDAMLLMLFTVLAIVLAHPFFFQTYHIGMKCRIAACYMIYKKSLRLSQSAMSQTTVGQMVNLLSNDVNRFDQVVQLVPYLVVAPLQSVAVVVILSLFYLGVYPTLASLVAIISYVIIQSTMGRGFTKLRAKTAKRTDERVRLMNEIILAMKIIKMYAWEKPFKVLVQTARRREITTIGFASILKAINQTLFFISSKVIVFVALLTYVLLGYSFNPEIVFVSIGLANLVRISLTLFFPNAIAYAAETMISCRRINDFLSLPEIETAPTNYKCSPDSLGSKYLVSLSKVCASWHHISPPTSASASASASTSTGPTNFGSTSASAFGGRSAAPKTSGEPDRKRAPLLEEAGEEAAGWAVLRDLSFQVKARELILVVGRVGSGKSSVLMSILGELPVSSGRLEVNGRVSYASQEAWIFSGTVRDNILFGKAHEPERYNEVVRVCSLERDLDILVDGDETIVGERGVSLSGGQKARVNLARALPGGRHLPVGRPTFGRGRPGGQAYLQRVAEDLFEEENRHFGHPPAAISALRQPRARPRPPLARRLRLPLRSDAVGRLQGGQLQQGGLRGRHHHGRRGAARGARPLERPPLARNRRHRQASLCPGGAPRRAAAPGGLQRLARFRPLAGRLEWPLELLVGLLVGLAARWRL